MIHNPDYTDVTFGNQFRVIPTEDVEYVDLFDRLFDALKMVPARFAGRIPEHRADFFGVARCTIAACIARYNLLDSEDFESSRNLCSKAARLACLHYMTESVPPVGCPATTHCRKRREWEFEPVFEDTHITPEPEFVHDLANYMQLFNEEQLKIVDAMLRHRCSWIKVIEELEIPRVRLSRRLKDMKKRIYTWLEEN